MATLAQIVAWLNVPANALGKLLLTPLAGLPGWLSNTIVAAVLGLVMLVVFKYTSQQRAIRRVRDDIKAHLLALKLFPDSLSVTFRAQGRILRGAAALLLLAIVPMLVMIVPVSLLFGQLSLWYQLRPLQVGEEAVVTVQLDGQPDAAWPDVKLEPTPAADVVSGPVRLSSRREICWNLKANQDGYHRLQLRVDGQPVEKQLAVGSGFMRVSEERPGWHWTDILLQPAEPPFRPDSPVQAIRIAYPDRPSWTSGTDWWLVYCFAASMFFALCFKPLLKVNL
jgi:hypothetical protein